MKNPLKLEIVQQQRQNALYNWVEQQLGAPLISIQAITGDASFRNYYRVKTPHQSYMAVDAPPEYDLGNEAFVYISRAFLAKGLRVPVIYHFNFEKGFLLVSDLGDEVYAKVLTANNVDNLYSQALEALVHIHTCDSIPNYNLPHFNSNFLRQELVFFQQWYLDKHLKLSLARAEKKLVESTLNTIIQVVESQPQCCVHRDYHSRNLLVVEGQTGIIDLQDAVWGPITYDAVSLLRDCYVAWPAEQVNQWALQFFDHLQQAQLLKHCSAEQFLRWFDFTGIQRHLKAIFIFARKYWRDNDARYLPDIQRALNYIDALCPQYKELRNFHDWLGQIILPTHLQVQESLV